uniref:Uncharacterized protein n=1 Tax=Eutreptiella gymnastica TaxID=73025 RepID=A0A6T1YHZ4_9EUGL|mmetsp:Transcript_43640/g.70810  ORF Transcript_43640/g.70810 Transcript_43640/m.70810 type:complete len:116 (+) Transcript_43640:684-1031(+)
MLCPTAHNGSVLPLMPTPLPVLAGLTFNPVCSLEGAVWVFTIVRQWGGGTVLWPASYCTGLVLQHSQSTASNKSRVRQPPPPQIIYIFRRGNLRPKITGGNGRANSPSPLLRSES